MRMPMGQFTRPVNLLAQALITTRPSFNILEKKDLPKDLITRTKDWKWKKWSLFETHLALFAPLQFTAASSNPDLAKTFIYVVGFETEKNLIEHFKVLKNGELKSSGMVEGSIKKGVISLFKWGI